MKTMKKIEREDNPATESKVLIVTGTPGVGKSSFTCIFASQINADVISVGTLVNKKKLYHDKDNKRDTYIADLKKVSKEVETILSKKSITYILEGHYAVEVVPPEKINLVFVLRRDPRILKVILKKRGYSKQKIWENLAAEILDVCLVDAINSCGINKVFEIDTTGKSFNDVVKEAVFGLNQKSGRRVGLVDWIGKLESEGELEEYLRIFSSLH